MIPGAVLVAIGTAVEVLVFNVMLCDYVWVVEGTQIAVSGAEVLCLMAMLRVLDQEIIVVDRTTLMVVFDCVR